MNQNYVQRPFAGLVQACAKRDISRSVAFELARNELIDTFLIGRRRYVYLDSLDTLGQRLKVRDADSSSDTEGLA